MSIGLFAGLISRHHTAAGLTAPREPGRPAAGDASGDGTAQLSLVWTMARHAGGAAAGADNGGRVG
jgi:hypothetical protein